LITFTRALDDFFRRAPRIFTVGVLLAGFLFVTCPAAAQDSVQTTITGTVVSYTQQSLLIKDEGNRYRLFVFDRNTVRPGALTPGSGVRITSTQTEDPEVRLALLIAPAQSGATPASTTTAQPDIVPPPLLSTQRAIEREARKFHFGVQGGIALNPELVDIGIHAKFGPFFSRNLQFRPSIDFGYGEVTKLFAVNGDFLYNLSPNRGARRSLYFGAGPQFNFAEQSVSGHGVDFSDFHYSNALNIILGIRFRSGLFTELKTSVYASPAPVLRMMAGYTF
jgi:hypothetical protein